ncbi:hypothetical protein C8J56DRAFT_949948 [Mycena floridula]|nr:hypothetical protein C8J56DRAFT_949948 [Mycena floridula]
MITPAPKTIAKIFCIILLLNGIILILNLRFSLRSIPQHTFIGSDFPVELPMTEKLEYVAMTLQETVHFQLNQTGADGTVIDDWRSLVMLPWKARVHVGPDQRLFNLVYFHQLHCLRELARTILPQGDRIHSHGHMMHCLHYLRQGFLCEADGRLEVGDFMLRDFESDRVADTLVCRDWEKVHNYLKAHNRVP